MRMLMIVCPEGRQEEVRNRPKKMAPRILHNETN